MILLSSFVFGLIFGSFLNVVIYRLKTSQFRGGTAVNITFGRSFCPQCKTALNWLDLLPIFSFIWLCGKCRYCRKKISWQYPIVEILSGLIWVLVFYRVFGIFGFEILDFFRISDFGSRIFDATYYIFIFSALIVIAVYDFKWRIIPDKIVYSAIAAVSVYNLFNVFKSLNIETFKILNFKYLNIEILRYINIEIFIYSLFTAFIAFLFFFSIFYFSNGQAMGLGDAKLGFLIGFFLGPLHSLIAFALSFIIGAAFGILLIVCKKKSWKSQIAFGPFLVLGVFIAFFLSDFTIKLLNF